MYKQFFYLDSFLMLSFIIIFIAVLVKVSFTFSFNGSFLLLFSKVILNPQNRFSSKSKYLILLHELGITGVNVKSFIFNEKPDIFLFVYNMYSFINAAILDTYTGYIRKFTNILFHGVTSTVNTITLIVSRSSICVREVT